MGTQKIVIAMTGASGAVLALELLRRLKACPEWETHFVMSHGAEVTISYELPGRKREFLDLADHVYDNSHIGAAIASGSFVAAGMVVVPCSMKTAAGIHSGYSDNLILRAADVTLKEGRPLVLVPRETPLSPIHLRNLYELSMMGVAVVPPMMTFYNGPQTVDDMVTHTVGKVLDRLGIPAEYRRWNG
nr:UbiX family flavin prenyltransferase [uncultured Oscillibacter sp.]